ncbi:MAG TPA: YdiU family protein [Sphingomicrobium sp.]|nr:YdiU family protein [Sphingomicrobium sp.]
MHYQPDVRIFELGDGFFDPVEPARFPRCLPRFLNRKAAETVGLGGLSGEQWAAHFCRFEPLPDNLKQPLALRYHGHQFRVYNPDIGDGRGFLFGQLRGNDHRLLDLGTKGSGQTPYSRTADGRLTLKGGVREVLATEMLQALGVNTSKSFALFETGEALERGDEPSPTRSSVLTRLSHSHIRIGTFQRQAFLGDTDALDRLVRYCLEHLYGEAPAADASENALRLFDLVAQATATLAASYMAAGFVHGVLNSDNINITGESFDYGPWRFTPYWDAEFTAAYFDHYGLYAFARQPEAINWDLAQLGGCLSLLVPEAQPLSDVLASWGDRFEQAFVSALLRRLGVPSMDAQSDRELAGVLLRALESRAATIDRIFFDWRGGRDPGEERYPGEPFRVLAAKLAGRERVTAHPYWSDPEPCSMRIEEVEAIWDAIAERDDWSSFNAKIEAIRRMGEAVHESSSRR